MESNNNLLKFVETLRNTIDEVKNDWTSKERETFIFNRLENLEFIESADFIKSNKNVINKLKEVYNSNDSTKFTTEDLKKIFPNIDINKIYIIQEPFGSKASPDFLFITIKGLFGLEDKSSKNGKVSFNTGTPGGNKFIMYYDRKANKIFLLTGKQWGWDYTTESEYKKFTQDMIEYCSKEFKRRFGHLKKLDYYARPMLVDKNKIKDICDKDEKDVNEMLIRYL
jgi:hypothetical protein